MTDVLTNFIGEFGAWRQDVESRLPPRPTFKNQQIMASPQKLVPTLPSTSRMPTPSQHGNQSHRVSRMKMELPGHAQASIPTRQDALFSGSQQRASPADSVGTDMDRTTAAGLQHKAGLQSDHTTPAHRLLEDWSAMQDWYKLSGYLAKLKDSGQNVSDYPMQLEQRRGLLRPWGYGEGQDLNGGAQGPRSPARSNESNASSPVPEEEGLWGYPPRDKASVRTVHGCSIPEDHVGELGPDGRPDFRVATMDRLLDSYERNMHNLHPIFDRSKLQKMFREFKDRYSPDAKGMKRKRRSSACGERYQPERAIEYSLRNATVLLVLALGAVCYDKKRNKPLPSPKSDKSPHSKNASGLFPDSNGSLDSDTTNDPRPKNTDLMPGMAYYSYATDILGSHHGGLGIENAQAYILAALYISQYARVLESWCWINSACRVTTVLVKADLDKLCRDWYTEKEPEKALTPEERYKLDQVLFVYWACLQLESDIVAEMSPLTTSDITAYQGRIMYPAGVRESFPINGMSMALQELQARPNEDDVLMIYSSQIYLRIIMNEAHNQLYGKQEL
ncbi:hypothetical protein HBI81_260710 [Parastagonospora nodorum]|nr:hypothetical protein HBH53_264470 [Parastagonospora nodorum]KAH3955976.1 hypothetical protein HBH51_259190 [Parastagonospora nodorum]KAH5095184.1 hypothetical protein HBH71_256420 [Parastagonospora nodorum]KAH6382929.1 hypothetical protein HBI60_259620 [Parastagonospora nodorum]KAH6510356.1 hypothetical protein HBI81_260710 [Parastagonospora nodorum]